MQATGDVFDKVIFFRDLIHVQNVNRRKRSRQVFEPLHPSVAESFRCRSRRRRKEEHANDRLP